MLPHSEPADAVDDEISTFCSELENFSSSFPSRHDREVVEALMKWCDTPFAGDAKQMLRVTKLLLHTSLRWRDVTVWIRVVLVLKSHILPRGAEALDDKGLLKAFQTFGLLPIEHMYAPIIPK